MKKFKITIAAFIIVGVIFGALSFILAGKSDIVITERGNTEQTDPQRVFDFADILTDQEEADLQKYIEEKQAEISEDIVLILLDDLSLQNHDALKEYAENTFTESGYGWNEANGDGVIYVDNWAEGADKKYTWMASHGIAHERLSQSRMDDIVDDTCENVNNDPYGSYKLFVDETVKYIKRGKGLHIPWFIAPLLALIAAAGFYIYQVSINAGVDTTSTDTYERDESFHMIHKEDKFLYKHVTSRKIEKSDSSRDSGGGDFGGSGGSH